jgi:cytochrome c oxidase cbb3-type subunit 3
MRRQRVAFVVAFAFAGLCACEERPSDLRPWRASDHDHTSQPSAAQVEAEPADGGPESLFGISEVVLAAWRQNCVVCHGIIGRGDGPQGPMVRASDLSQPDFQARLSDEQIAEVIQRGRGAMPAFPLPEQTVTGLVKLVRLFDASRRAPRDAGTLDGTAQDSAAAEAGSP